MKARLYFAAVLFLCIRVYESLTQIPLFFRVHTDLTDLTGFARLMLNLTLSLHRELAKPNNYPKNNLK